MWYTYAKGMVTNMEDYTLTTGDIILVDSQKGGAKIVKFFMTAPTWVQYLWRAIRGTQKHIPYYHVRMAIPTSTEPLRCIEQQAKVETRDWNPLSVQAIFRTNLTEDQKVRLTLRSIEDIGQGYDILNIVGKTLTWLTGIKVFGRYLQWPRAEVCVNRVAYWYEKEVGETFGAVTHSEVTTQSMYESMLNNPKYTCVYQKTE